MDESEADDSGDDEEGRDDVIEQPRDHQDEHAGDERYDGLEVANAESHDFVLGGG